MHGPCMVNTRANQAQVALLPCISVKEIQGALQGLGVHLGQLDSLCSNQ